MNRDSKPVIFIMGTTASGKSDWALRLAQKFQGVIVNCDSVQLYKKLDIGAAKPTLAERALVPHYLLDYIEAPREMTAGQYRRDFDECLESLPTGKPIFVVGGTGFYFMAIEKGMYPVTSVSEELKQQVEAEVQVPGGAARLLQELQTVDPEYAAKLHLADHYRLGRAIELIRSQGKSVTQIQKEFSEQQKDFAFPLLKIGPNWSREALRERIALRSQKMLEQGLVAEVQSLLDEGLGEWGPLRSVGYRETIQCLRGEFPQEQLLAEINQGTAQLAKKQRTWFQKDAEIFWSDGADGYMEAEMRVEKFLIA